VPARYGNRLSGVIDIEPRTWSGKDYNAVGASLLFSHALSQGRLDSYPVEWLASARRGNVDLVADALERTDAEPDFLDALGRLQVEVGPRAMLAAGYLLLDDTLKANLDEGAERGDIEYRDATGWAAWTFRPNDASEVRATASRTERHTNRVGSLNQPDNARGTVDDHRIFDTNTLRLEASARTNSWLSVTGGLEWYQFDAEYRYQSQVQFGPEIAAAFGRSLTYAQSTDLVAGGEAYAAFASTLISFSRRTTLDVALRWDAQAYGVAFRDNQLSPRFGLQYEYSPLTTLRLSWGRLAQTERPDELQVQDGDSAFHPAQRSTQAVLSAERRVASVALLRLEVYDKRVSNPTPLHENLLDPFALLPELQVDRVRVQPDRSRIRGAELSVRWQLPQTWSGWASYSWSNAEDLFGPVSVPRTWDQRNALATGLAWTNRPWQFSTSLAWHSGWRRNQLVTTPTGLALDPRNAQAWPAYLSLDLRTTWSRPLPKGVLDVFGEIDNSTNHSNLCCSSYRLSGSGSGTLLAPEQSGWLPRLFLIGVTWQLP
ncbi:MAG: TonB-dependent receptor, partial [Gammaproteobacteria bacterium]